MNFQLMPSLIGFARQKMELKFLWRFILWIGFGTVSQNQRMIRRYVWPKPVRVHSIPLQAMRANSNSGSAKIRASRAISASYNLNWQTFRMDSMGLVKTGFRFEKKIEKIEKIAKKLHFHKIQRPKTDFFKFKKPKTEGTGFKPGLANPNGMDSMDMISIRVGCRS